MPTQTKNPETSGFIVAATRKLQQLQDEEAEAREHLDMVKQSLDQDPELAELAEKVKEAQRAYRLQKEAILNEPENRAAIEKLKDTRASIKDIKLALSGDLVFIVTQENTLEFEDAEGNLRRISLKATVAKTNQPSLFS